METIDKMHEIFKQYVGTSQRLSDEEKRVWAIRATKAEYQAFLDAFGQDVQAAILYVRCLAEAPNADADSRIKAVRDRLSLFAAGITGKTVQELEQDNAAKDGTIAQQSKRIEELENELAAVGRAMGRKN
jgi:hypothetical protein